MGLAGIAGDLVIIAGTVIGTTPGVGISRLPLSISFRLAAVLVVRLTGIQIIPTTGALPGSTNQDRGFHLVPTEVYGRTTVCPPPEIRATICSVPLQGLGLVMMAEIQATTGQPGHLKAAVLHQVQEVQVVLDPLAEAQAPVAAVDVADNYKPMGENPGMIIIS